MWRQGRTPTIQVGWGDLAAQGVDALLISANNWLQAGSGAALEVKRAVGPGYEHECRNLVQGAGRYGLPQGRGAVTDGHDLAHGRARGFVLHAITIYYPRRHSSVGRIGATPGTVYWSVRETLALAETRGIESVATHLMATRDGYRTQRPESMARALFRALRDHLTTTRTLKDIVVIEQDWARMQMANDVLKAVMHR